LFSAGTRPKVIAITSKKRDNKPMVKASCFFIDIFKKIPQNQ